MAESVILLFISLEEKRKRKTRGQILKTLRDKSEPFSLPEETFIKFFRLPKLIAKALIDEIKEFDQQNSTIPFVLRLLAVLNFFANGCYQKGIANNYLVATSQPVMSRSITYICNLITNKMGKYIKFPQTEEEKRSTKIKFFQKFEIRDTIGCIDCTHVAIISPPIFDTHRPAHLYMNRKGYHSINVEAVCDSDLKFLYLNPRYPGSCHDSGIWATSKLRMHLIEHYKRGNPTWLIGDSGYPLEPWLMTPVLDPQNHKETRYNELHIKSRNCIERAFGVVKSRFRCLDKNRALHYTPPKAALITTTCIILHNFLIHHGYSIEENFEERILLSTENGQTTLQESEYLNEGRRIRNIYINTF